jgi:hypothetical protein
MLALRKISPWLGLCGLALCGCAADRPGDVPAGADAQIEGTQRLVYTAPSNGQIWVTDVDSATVVYAGRVGQGDEVSVDPDNDRVTKAGQVVVTHDVGHENHKIYFEPGIPVQGVTDPAGTNVQRPAAIPSTANLTGEGANRVSYTAAGPGTIWIVDVQQNAVLYTGRVLMGDEVVIDPDHGNLTINGKKSDAQILNNSDRSIYFMPATDPARQL